MEKYLRFVSTIALVGILIVLILIWVKLPQKSPTLEDIREAKGNRADVQQVLNKIPFVNISGTVPVNVQNSELDVNVKNSELDVKVKN